MRQVDLAVASRGALVERVLLDLAAWRFDHLEFGLVVVSKRLRAFVVLLFASVRGSVLSSFIHVGRRLQAPKPYYVVRFELKHHGISAVEVLDLVLLHLTSEESCLWSFFEVRPGKLSGRSHGSI